MLLFLSCRVQPWNCPEALSSYTDPESDHAHWKGSSGNSQTTVRDLRNSREKTQSWYGRSDLGCTWNRTQLGHFSQPRERFWARLKKRHHEVWLLLAVGLGVQHSMPLRTRRREHREEKNINPWTREFNISALFFSRCSLQFWNQAHYFYQSQILTLKMHTTIP